MCLKSVPMATPPMPSTHREEPSRGHRQEGDGHRNERGERDYENVGDMPHRYCGLGLRPVREHVFGSAAHDLG